MPHFGAAEAAPFQNELHLEFFSKPVEAVPLQSAVKLLQPEALPHEPLQAGLVDNVVGQFLVGEHG